MLDLACGTGLLAAEAALKGAVVTALESQEAMLVRARERARFMGLEGSIRFLKAEPSQAAKLLEGEEFDVIAAAFVLSELPRSLRQSLLEDLGRLASPRARLIVVDEMVTSRRLRRALAAGLRWPLAAAAGLISGHLHHPLKDLEGSLVRTGWSPRSKRRLLAGTIGVFVAERSS
jgi:2-polyprenyl-3-methyl-5-hydroxy-6-metoxy-1,4-benzoquinol methylase